MYYTIVATALIALGISLLFFIDNIITEDTDNTLFKNIRDNNLIVGMICLLGGYYLYNLSELEQDYVDIPDSSKSFDSSSPLVENALSLPSYQETSSNNEI